MQVAKSCSAKLQCVVSTARILKSSFERNPQCHNRVSSVHRRSSKYQRKNPLSSGCLKFPYSILESLAEIDLLTQMDGWFFILSGIIEWVWESLMARWRSKATAGKLISRSLHLRLSFFNSLSALSLALLSYNFYISGWFF